MFDVSSFIVSKGIISRQWPGNKIFGKDDDLSLLRDSFFYKLLGFSEVFPWGKLLNSELHDSYFYSHVPSSLRLPCTRYGESALSILAITGPQRLLRPGLSSVHSLE